MLRQLQSSEKSMHVGLRIGFDFRFVQASYRNSADGGLGGVGVYTRGLWRAMVRMYPENCFVALVDHGDIPHKLRELIGLAPHVEIMPFGLMGRGPVLRRFDRSSYSWILRALESEFGLGIAKMGVGLDVLHITNETPAPQIGCPTVVTLYDLYLLGAGRRDEPCLRERLHRWYLKRLGRADSLVCISESTRNDVLRYMPESAGKTTLSYPGIDLETFVPKATEKTVIRDKYGIDRDYFIHAGVCAGRKNPKGLIDAMKIAVEKQGGDFMLVLVGPYQVNRRAADAILGLAQDHGIADRVKLLGDVSDAQLAELYRGALALVFPSHYEGFGYPVAEALACGTPCVVSNASSLPEVAGHLGFLVDPDDPGQIASGMVSILESGRNHMLEAEGPLWARKFSWDNAARAYMETYRALADNAKRQGNGDL